MCNDIDMSHKGARNQAKLLGLKRYFTGKPCVRGHIAERVVAGGCVECAAENSARYWEKKAALLPPKQPRVKKIPDKAKILERQRRYAAEHPEVRRGINKRQYAANSEDHKRRSREWRAKNPERVAESKRAWREKNRERVAAYKQAYREIHVEEERAYRKARHIENRDYELQRMKEWRKANMARMAAHVARRNATKVRATPAWANPEKIQALYDAARAMSMLTGRPHHVDHIVPLHSKKVCGLHCEDNLQILLGLDNQSKSNRFDPDMPFTAVAAGA
jgi:hypothetical protein